MNYYLFLSLLVVAVCEAGVITSVDHSHHGVYHGHGATSYQNVQLDNHDTIVVPANYGDPAEIQQALEHHHEPIIPIVESHNDINHIDVSHSAPYEDFTIADIKLKSDILEHIFDHDHEKHDYDFHL